MEEVRYLQLRWDNWNEMCDFAGVGTLENGQPMGCWLDENGLPTHTPRPDINRIGLLIPTKDGILVARQTDYVVRGKHGLAVYTQGEFENIFKPHLSETTKSPRARLAGRGRKAGRKTVAMRILPEAWAEIQRAAESAGLHPGELLERVFTVAKTDASSTISEMVNEKVWRR